MCGNSGDDPSMHDHVVTSAMAAMRCNSPIHERDGELCPDCQGDVNVLPAFDGGQYRNHMVGCTADYNHPNHCVVDVGCRTFFDPQNVGMCANCGQTFAPNHTEVSFGPVLNSDGTPTEMTKGMLAGTGRHAGWVVLDDGGIHLEIS